MIERKDDKPYPGDYCRVVSGPHAGKHVICTDRDGFMGSRRDRFLKNDCTIDEAPVTKDQVKVAAVVFTHGPIPANTRW